MLLADITDSDLPLAIFGADDNPSDLLIAVVWMCGANLREGLRRYYEAHPPSSEVRKRVEANYRAR